MWLWRMLDDVPIFLDRFTICQVSNSTFICLNKIHCFFNEATTEAKKKKAAALSKIVSDWREAEIVIPSSQEILES